jgi:hypothetical protein
MVSRLRDRFWDWATSSFIRFGTVLLVAHAIVSAPRRRRKHG